MLHRLDPRLKVLTSLLLVMLAFAASTWLQLIVLAVALMFAVWTIAPLAGQILGLCWRLRWFLLFTLLLHLLLSPGRTLFGTGWLSLDGLLSGLLVCVQMLIAVVAVTLLAMTTSTAQLAGTFGWFVRPLQWLGCRTDEWQRLLLLSLDFIPVVQEEMRATMTPDGNHSGTVLKNAGGLWSAWSQKLHGLLVRLVARSDVLAHRLAAKELPCAAPAALAPLTPVALQDQFIILTVTLVIFCYWIIG